jgi:hypothetical protein
MRKLVWDIKPPEEDTSRSANSPTSRCGQFRMGELHQDVVNCAAAAWGGETGGERYGSLPVAIRVRLSGLCKWLV